MKKAIIFLIAFVILGCTSEQRKFDDIVEKKEREYAAEKFDLDYNEPYEAYEEEQKEGVDHGEILKRKKLYGDVYSPHVVVYMYEDSVFQVHKFDEEMSFIDAAVIYTADDIYQLRLSSGVREKIADFWWENQPVGEEEDEEGFAIPQIFLMILIVLISILLISIIVANVDPRNVRA